MREALFRELADICLPVKMARTAEASNKEITKISKPKECRNGSASIENSKHETRNSKAGVM
jgi:hypothetical protein